MGPIETAIEQIRRDDLAKLTEHTTRSYQSENTEDKGWKHEQTWSFINGESVMLDGGFDGDILVPATAGYELVWFEGWKCDDPSAYDIPEYVSRMPVIGWKFYEDLVIPITVASREVPSGIWSFKGISYPDGRVAWYAPFQNRSQYDEYQPICASLEEWIGLAREVWPEVIKREEEEEQRRAEAEKPCPECGRHDGDQIPF